MKRKRPIKRQKRSFDRQELFLKRFLLIPLALIAYGFTSFCQAHPQWTEQQYSQKLYPKLVGIIGYLPAMVNFSVAEVLFLILLLAFLGYLIYVLRSVISNERGRGKRLYHLGATLVALLCGIYVVFTLLCGPNYYRQTFAQQAGFELKTPKVSEVRELCQELAGELDSARVALDKAQIDTSYDEEKFAHYGQQAVTAMTDLGTSYPILTKVSFSKPKPVWLSEGLSYANIAGIFIPFTMESNVNRSAPFFTQPATMAHELVHQAGFMREDEANYLAYRACRQSQDPLLVYSGLFLAFDYSLAALKKTAPDQAATIKEGLSEAVQTDLAQSQHYWQQHQGLLFRLSSKMNNWYLKANRQSDGVASYNRMVTLLVAERRANSED